MGDQEQIELYDTALHIVCKMLRKNPMGDITTYPPGMLQIVYGGADRDPNGNEYFDYFLNIAKQVRKFIEEKEGENG